MAVDENQWVQIYTIKVCWHRITLSPIQIGMHYIRIFSYHNFKIISVLTVRLNCCNPSRHAKVTTDLSPWLYQVGINFYFKDIIMNNSIGMVTLRREAKIFIREWHSNAVHGGCVIVGKFLRVPEKSWIEEHNVFVLLLIEWMNQEPYIDSICTVHDIIVHPMQPSYYSNLVGIPSSPVPCTYPIPAFVNFVSTRIECQSAV